MSKQQIIDYVMTTPVNTNPMILKQLLDELEGSGGGGGSDWHTATVTLIGAYGDFELFALESEEFPRGYTGIFYLNGQWTITPGTNEISQDVYQATYTLYYSGNEFTAQLGNTYISSTGAVTYNEETNAVTITGDCTITGYISD